MVNTTDMVLSAERGGEESADTAGGTICYGSDVDGCSSTLATVPSLACASG